MAQALKLYTTLQDNGQYQSSISPLIFKDVTLADLPEISAIIRKSRSMTCDYTIGGIYMWIDYFKYKFCIYKGTLFISGVAENHLDTVAFSCPIGDMPLPAAIELLKEYCRQNGLPLQFSAIPADKLICFTTINPECKVEELTDWSDYVYMAESFATLSGKKMSKKRNHVNHFMSEYPSATLEPLTCAIVPELVAAVNRWHAADTENTSATKDEELRETVHVLQNFTDFGFDGAILRLEPDGEIAGFSLAEVIGDTAFVHIEKMNHTISGAGETLAHLFMEYLTKQYPDLRYSNREEDCGDPGLRYAKESWHPAMLLKKYNVIL